MWEDGTVFECYTNMWDVIFFSELGSSWTVLAAGYTVDTLMLRYQGVDWTNLDNWDCNARLAARAPYVVISSIPSRAMQSFLANAFAPCFQLKS